jgi:hypothetical protein
MRRRRQRRSIGVEAARSVTSRTLKASCTDADLSGPAPD